MSTIGIAAMIGLLIGALGAALIVYAWMRQIQATREIRNELEVIRTQLDDTKAQVEWRDIQLESAAKRGRKHHSYDTVAAFQDAMALLLQENMDEEVRKARRETLLGILQTASKGPGSYDPERPSGKR